MYELIATNQLTNQHPFFPFSKMFGILRHPALMIRTEKSCNGCQFFFNTLIYSLDSYFTPSFTPSFTLSLVLP